MVNSDRFQMKLEDKHIPTLSPSFHGVKHVEQHMTQLVLLNSSPSTEQQDIENVKQTFQYLPLIRCKINVMFIKEMDSQIYEKPLDYIEHIGAA